MLQSKHAQRISAGWEVGAVFALALLVRFYLLDHHPLWLDEIYGYQLIQLGFMGVLRNSLTDPHPPLYYFIQWAVSGFGFLHSEIAWRWFPALSGAGAVAITYRLARMHVSWISAALACGVFAIAPMHLYFSQEARSPAFMTLLAAITMLLLYYLHQSPQRTALWVGHFSVALVGIYCSYNFVLVISMQLLYLAVFGRHWWPTLRYAALFSLCCAPLIVPFWTTLSSVAAQHASSTTTNLFEILQALVGGDPIRYGFSWAHLWLCGLLCLLAFAGIAFRVGFARLPGDFTFYYVLQWILPFVLFFGIFEPLFRVNLILTEAKHFMVLLPAWFVMVAQGTERFWRINMNPVIVVRSLLVGLYAVALVASMIGIQRYWAMSKSPEGLAVLHVREHAQPGDVVVSLHYSLNAAMSFYLPEMPTYTYPREADESYLFTTVTHVIWTQPVAGQFDPTIPLATIHTHPRIWVLSHGAIAQDIVQAVGQGCTVDSTWQPGVFHVVLLHHCAP
jgi:uncharacterized membrane protein